MSGGLLGRWARRKQEVRRREREERTVAPETLPETSPETSPGTVAAGAPAPRDGTEAADALAEAIARLPRIEDLTAASDLGPFLRAGIPAVLRNAALRRMWSVDPAIRDFVSEAREYAYDWNIPGGVPGRGPMLPTDDIGAMVERVMTGHAPRPAIDRPEPPGGEPAVAEELPASPGPEAMPVRIAEAASCPAEAAPRPAEAAPPLAEATPRPDEAMPAAPGERAPEPRLRRHGGALPS